MGSAIDGRNLHSLWRMAFYRATNAIGDRCVDLGYIDDLVIWLWNVLPVALASLHFGV